MNKTDLFSTVFVKSFSELKPFFLIIFQQLNTDFFLFEFLTFFFFFFFLLYWVFIAAQAFL